MILFSRWRECQVPAGGLGIGRGATMRKDDVNLVRNTASRNNSGRRPNGTDR